MYMQTTPRQLHLGARFIDGVVAVIVGAMSSFWLDGALAAEPTS